MELAAGTGGSAAWRHRICNLSRIRAPVRICPLRAEADPSVEAAAAACRRQCASGVEARRKRPAVCGRSVAADQRERRLRRHAQDGGIRPCGNAAVLGGDGASPDPHLSAGSRGWPTVVVILTFPRHIKPQELKGKSYSTFTQPH